jgi:hypothetical protein
MKQGNSVLYWEKNIVEKGLLAPLIIPPSHLGALAGKFVIGGNYANLLLSALENRIP